MSTTVPRTEVEELRRRLHHWYAANARDLPWRAADRTPWGVLVSEVMLQQTPVARVLPVWAEWMRLWPEPAALAVAAPAEAIRRWGRLGYPRRALRLREAAAVIDRVHDGVVPSAYDELLRLPGVGAYTASAVASFAFGHRHSVVDTNVRRVQARAFSATAQAAPAVTARERELADAVLPEPDHQVPGWNVAVMELGALVCQARAPRCGACPWLDRCAWQRAGAPPYAGPKHPVQGWHGTDRQVRGRLLAALRDSLRPLRADELVAVCPAPSLRDGGQRDRCLSSLIDDGLVEALPGDRFRLPG